MFSRPETTEIKEDDARYETTSSDRHPDAVSERKRRAASSRSGRRRATENWIRIMAAKSVTIRFYRVGGSDEPALRVEPRWWDADELCADPRFTMTNETGSYFDWSADLTVAEFRAMHEDFRPLATSSFYEAPDWQEIIQPRMQVIDGALSGALGEIEKINVTVFEWESGLGD
jgi:hypothetical protein